MAALLMGVGITAARHSKNLTEPQPGTGRYRGVVKEVVERETSRSMVVDVKGLGYNVYITTPAFNPELLCGDSISFECQLEPIEEVSAVEGLNDLNTYYFVHRVGATGFVTPDNFHKTTGDQLTIQQWLVHQRHRWVAEIMHSDMSQGAARLLAATFLGERGAMDQEEVQHFRDAGAAHVLALSGLHAALVWLVITMALWPLRSVGGERVVKVVAITLLWAYVLFTGLTPSVVRAAVMVTMVAVGQMIERRNSVFNALLAAMIVILVVEPEALFDVSFQLSFVAVAGLLIWGAWFQGLKIRSRWMRTALGAVGVTMSAVIATSMLTAYYFHRLPLLFLLVNIPLALLFPLFLGVGIVWCLLALVGWNCAPLIWLLNLLYNGMDWVVSTVAGIGGGVVDGLYITPWAVITWMLALVAIGGWIYFRRRVWVMACGVCVVASVALLTVVPCANTPQMLIDSRRDHTMVMVNDGAECKAFTIGLPKDSAYHNEYWSERLTDYAGSRRLGAPTVIHLSTSQLNVAGERWLILNDDELEPTPCDVILICRGYMDRARSCHEVVAATGAKRVYLSGDLNARISQRLAQQLADVQGVEVISLRGEQALIKLSRP